MEMTMNTTMWFHFTPGDTLWFHGWVTGSPGAMVGACLGLFVLAVFERWLAATRAVLEGKWALEAQVAAQNAPAPPVAPSSVPTSTSEKKKDDPSLVMLRRPFASASRRTRGTVSAPRMAPPFIWKHDLLRGLVYAVQLGIGFAVMLVIMTFQLAFIFSLIVGAGVGEVIFGRYASSAALAGAGTDGVHLH